MAVASDADEAYRQLERTSRRLEAACAIIQAVHDHLTIEEVLDGIVENLVEVAGFSGAEISIDATIDNLRLHHVKAAGAPGGDASLTRTTSVFIRGAEVGTLTTHYLSEVIFEEQSELLEFVLPTLFMGIDHAVSFAEVIDYRRTLEEKVIERTAQLADANHQLQEAKAARDRFFANINHEIRTPLALIQLSTDGISRSGETLSASTREKLDSVNASTRRLLQLVNSLLLLAAGDEGKLKIKPQPLDVAASLKRFVANWQPAATHGELRLEYVGPATCPSSLDEMALETVIGNFLSNATKFTPAGGTITVTLHEEPDVLRIAVRDTGHGIDADFIPKLFGRFERSASATTRGVRGTGIGLSLSRDLIELQGGEIEVERHEAPRGTSFRIVIPRYQPVVAIALADDIETRVPYASPATLVEAASAPVAASAPAATSEPAATILLAEDDPALARNIADLLSTKYRVLTAPNGRIALDMAREHLPDLLVTDLEMPEMNGLELTREFRQLEGTKLSPVLIVSAHGALGKRLEGFEAGAVDYVVKPFSSDELLARVRSQLAIRSLALKLHESQKLAALGMLSAGLAHEIRNPANALVNSLGPLLELLPAEEREPGSTGAVLSELALDAAGQIRERCKNILDYSRSERVNRSAEDFDVMIARVRRLLTHVLLGVEFRVENGFGKPIHCAGPLVEQILINLIDNAAYAAGPNGWVRVVVRDEGELAAVEVSDSGPGVPAHLQERIFDPFFTTKPVSKGTGLGLTISRRIALNHGGNLRLLRHETGTTFRLELPVLTDLYA